MKNKAIIWDMDGVISDTQNFHAKIESNLLRLIGIGLSPEEITSQYAGRNTREWVQELIDKLNIHHYTAKDFMEKKWEYANFFAYDVKPMSGAINLIKQIAKSGRLVQAVASSSPFPYVHNILGTLEVSDYFSSIISGDLVSRGKPDPEIFNLAANELGLNPRNCVVIEDSSAGMTAAKAAGMKCIGLIYDIRNWEKYSADLLVDDLRKLNLDTILRL